LIFEHACKLGLEGIVSEHRDRAYRADARRTGCIRAG
jgi:ATP-dependent DNA ligase